MEKVEEDGPLVSRASFGFVQSAPVKEARAALGFELCASPQDMRLLAGCQVHAKDGNTSPPPRKRTSVGAANDSHNTIYS